MVFGAGNHANRACLHFLLLLLFSVNVAFSGTLVTSIPGFDGDLPFRLYTGYITVDTAELFYYFIESEGNPREDPLLLWYSGGPGCSAFNGLIYENGPLAFNITSYAGGLPQTYYYPYSWTKSSSILYVDAPVGTGFSYATSLDAYPVTDSTTAKQVYQFIRKWLVEHPQYLLNQFFVGADSYSGISGPIVVKKIIDDNDAGVKPQLNLKGYILGCPRTDATINENSKIIYVHRMGLVSDELYEAAKESCNGNYVDVPASEAQCYEDLRLLQITFSYALSYAWANDIDVRKALNIREGTVFDWKRCNESLSYSSDVSSVLEYHRNLSTKGLQVLIYNGDHDLTIPNIGTQEWIKWLNLSTVEYGWRPWFVDGQIAGYTAVYSSSEGYRLTYASVKGAGHSPQEYKRRECFDMFDRYIGVGDTDDVQLFYYFVESERSPVEDPLVLWLTGGPGCSGFSALAYEIGPFGFDYENYNGTLPSILLNPYSWTKVANIIFIDAPVGAGFSYAQTSSGYYTTDTKSAAQTYTFLRKWLLRHPNFLGNQLYIGGDSYSGLIVPLLLQNILKGLEAGLRPKMELQGYLLGNPVTDSYTDVNFRIPYVHRVNLISDELYEDAKLYCNEDYVNVNINNTLCVTALQGIKECLLQINLCQILEPQCAFSSGKPKELEWDLRAQEARTMNFLLSQPELPELRCRGFTYVLSYKWLNDDRVRDALYVREGTVETWKRCPKNFSTYTADVTSSVAYQKNLTETGLRALIYSGDHDISVPYIATLAWIKALGVAVFDEWRPWFVDGQIAGYQVKFMNDHYRLTYVTGAGHTAPEYKHKETLAMVDRFFARYPI
ncbi:Serine carboxypeptidase-like 18 [Morella rubra]|uniref:Serine carboxypeptidase-like 18 n=1 Tax=Morella rubra TaxID=262757 RepID=A0A6A1V6K3_9ROSI|nr:Serine carboxypeptidase-like 18 [Morella rubra]